MKKIYTIILVLVVSVSAFGQAPNWDWARYSGGSDWDAGHSISTDANGNVFVTGTFNSPTIKFGTITLTNAGYNDIFIIKYDAIGNVLWAKSVSGTSEEISYGLTIDVNGDLFVTGIFNDKTIIFDSIVLKSADYNNIFVAKYNTNGNVLWAKYATGAYTNRCFSISTDSKGNACITGDFYSPKMIFGTDTIFKKGATDMFIAKYDNNGNVLWVMGVGGGAAGCYGISVASDTSGNVLITGNLYGSTIIFGKDTLKNTTKSVDSFIAKYDANGNPLWAKSIGGSSDDYSKSIATDINGNVFLIGYSDSPKIIFGSDTLISNGSNDIIVAKYDGNGNILWAKNIGNSGTEDGSCVTTDANGNVYIVGSFNSQTISFGTTILGKAGSVDMFISKLDGSGNFLWAKRAGGYDQDVANSVSTDILGNIFITGYFKSPTISFGASTFTNADKYGNTGDFFITKLGSKTVNLNQTFEKNGLSLFPNPSSTNLTISGLSQANQTISISNIVGEVLQTESSKGANNVEVNVSNLPVGLYFVSAGGRSFKFIKK